MKREKVMNNRKCWVYKCLRIGSFVVAEIIIYQLITTETTNVVTKMAIKIPLKL